MAEAFGVVAGGISILQISAKIIALQQLWADVKEAPRKVNHLLDEINHVAAFLPEIEADFNFLRSDSSGEHIIRWCQIALDDLTVVLNDLSSELEQRRGLKRGALRVKISLKRDFWEKHEARLSQIVRMLSFVHQRYLFALTKQQSSIIIARLESARNPPLPLHRIGKSLLDAQPANQQDDVIEISRGNEKYRTHGVFDRSDSVVPWLGPSVLGWVTFGSTKESNEHFREKDHRSNSFPQRYVQIRPPSWLTNKAWDYLFSNTFVGWKFHLRSYSIVPMNAPVFCLVKNGDFDGLVDLFKKGLASPFDRDPDGETLLTKALVSYQTKLLPSLVEWGLDFAELYHPTIEGFFWPLTASAATDWSVIHQLALSKSAYDEVSDDWSYSGRVSCNLGLRMVLSWNSEATKLTLQHLRPQHCQLNIIDRLQFFNPTSAFHIAYESTQSDAEALRYVLRHDGKMSALDVLASNQLGYPIIVLIASKYRIGLHSSAVSIKKQKHWRKLSRTVIPLTTHFHSQPLMLIAEATYGCPSFRSYKVSTALLEIIGLPYAFPRQMFPSLIGTFSSWRRNVERALAEWLEDLSVSGVDLNAYGNLEKLIFINSRESWCSHFEQHYVCRCCLYETVTWRLEDFKYGPFPKDWVFSWDLWVERFVGEFWDLIEQPPLHIVGEYFDDEEEGHTGLLVGMGVPHQNPKRHDDSDSENKIEVLDLDAESDKDYEDESNEQRKRRKRTRTLKVVEELRKRQMKQIMSVDGDRARYEPLTGEEYNGVLDSFGIIR